MKFLPILLMAFMLTACGSAQQQKTNGAVAKMNSINQTTASSDTTTNSTTDSSSATVEKYYSKRDVNFNGLPWKNATADKLKSMVDQGKVVFLWSDADKIESGLNGAINWKKPLKMPQNMTEDELKQNSRKGWNGYAQDFIYEMEKRHPSKINYLNELKQACSLMMSGDETGAQSALDKAIQIRTGQ